MPPQDTAERLDVESVDRAIERANAEARSGTQTGTAVRGRGRRDRDEDEAATQGLIGRTVSDFEDATGIDLPGEGNVLPAPGGDPNAVNPAARRSQTQRTGVVDVDSVDTTRERSDAELDELSPTSRSITRPGVREQLIAGEQEIERRAARGNLLAQTFEGGTAIQEFGEDVGQAIDQGDPVTGGIGAAVGGAGLAIGLPGQAVGAVGLAGREGVERVATDETVESIAFGGSRQVEAAAERPIETGVAVAAPGVAGRGARAAAPRARSVVSDLGFSGRGVDRAQLELAGPRSRRRGATEDLPTEIAGTEPVPRGAGTSLRPGQPGQALAAESVAVQGARGPTLPLFADTLRPQATGATGGGAGAGAAGGAALAGATERQTTAQQREVTLEDDMSGVLEDLDAPAQSDADPTISDVTTRQRESQEPTLDTQTDTTAEELDALDGDQRQRPALDGLTDIPVDDTPIEDTAPTQQPRQRERALPVTTTIPAQDTAPIEDTPPTEDPLPEQPPPRRPPRGLPVDGGGDRRRREDEEDELDDIFSQTFIAPVATPEEVIGGDLFAGLDDL